MARNTYYYFKLRNGREYAIKETMIEINCNIMRMYRELTKEQRVFYLANPTASVQEVVACQLTPPYVPPTPELSEYISRKVAELKQACYDNMSVTTLEYAMASDKVNHPTMDCYYKLAAANAIVVSFRSESKRVMGVFDTYKPMIEAAADIAAVDVAYNDAMNELKAR